jgi:hypothetical protein
VARKRAVVGAGDSAGGGGGPLLRAGPTEQREIASERAVGLTSGACGSSREGDARVRGVGADSSVPTVSERERG